VRPLYINDFVHFQVIPSLVSPCVHLVSTVQREPVVTGHRVQKAHSAMSLALTISPTATNVLGAITVTTPT